MPTDTFTPNLHLIIQAGGDTNWGATVNAIWSYLDGLSALAGLNVVPYETPVSTSLKVWLTAGYFTRLSDSTEITVPGTQLTMTANVTNSIYLDYAGAPHVSTTGYPAGEILKLARVACEASTVASIIDDRRFLWTSGYSIQSVFGASGASHSVGLVPDPGAVAGTTHFLCENGTWALPPGTTLAGLSLAAQTGTPTGTLYAVSSGGGLFAVSLYACITTAGSSGNLQVTLQWVDDTGSTQSVTAVALAITSLGYQYANVVVRARTGVATNITYTVSFSGTAGSVHYSLYAAVRRLI
jgi:hypothetical protein